MFRQHCICLLIIPPPLIGTNLSVSLPLVSVAPNSNNLALISCRSEIRTDSDDQTLRLSQSVLHFHKSVCKSLDRQRATIAM